MPPGGWHYPQVLSSGETIKIHGFTFEQALQNILEFRTRHPDLCGGSAEATIEQVRIDLKKYLCSHFKQNCADAPTMPHIPSRTGIGIANYERPIDRASDWLSRVGHQHIEKVDAALAAQRAQVCAGCPQNIRWATPCQPCNEHVLVSIQNAKGSAHTPYDRNLFSCRMYGWTNEVAVWLTNPMGKLKENQKPPDICWAWKLNG
jgi:hypothetical protein